MSFRERCVLWLLRSAGIEIDGPEPWDPQVADSRFFEQVARRGILGAGETFRESWEVERLDLMVERLIRARVHYLLFLNPSGLRALWNSLFVPYASLSHASRVAEQHYDLPVALFEAILGPLMQYSCCWWGDGVEDLATAEEEKVNLIARKLGLERGMRVLSIGCGWGTTEKYLAGSYGVQVVGVTNSDVQAAYARQLAGSSPLEIWAEDYRTVPEMVEQEGSRGRFDRVMSIGMIEHVEPWFYRQFMKVVDAVMKRSGLFLLHTIGNSGWISVRPPFVSDHIFPVGMIPLKRQLRRAIRDLFVERDLHEWGSRHYYRTLKAWEQNLKRGLPRLRQQHPELVDDLLERNWLFYLGAAAGAFRADLLDVWQFVFSKGGAEYGYQPVR